MRDICRRWFSAKSNLCGTQRKRPTTPVSISWQQARPENEIAKHKSIRSLIRLFVWLLFFYVWFVWSVFDWMLKWFVSGCSRQRCPLPTLLFLHLSLHPALHLVQRSFHLADKECSVGSCSISAEKINLCSASRLHRKICHYLINIEKKKWKW